MSKMIFKGVEYELKDSLTLGDTHEMSKAFGGIDPDDKIATTIWIVYRALHERNPDVTFDYVLKLDWKDIEVIKDDEPQEDDAVPPAQAAAQDEPQGAAI